jgi:fatty acid desaturase (delta-4 desaturase)
MVFPACRQRVRDEVFKGGEAKGAHRTGSEGAAAVILGYAAASYAIYATNPSILAGFLLGLGGAWIGLTVQHCGNHGACRGGAPLPADPAAC